MSYANTVSTWIQDLKEGFEPLIKGSFASILLRACGHFLRLCSAIIIARFLGVEGYGIYSYAFAVTAILSTPSMLGLDHLVVRFIPGYIKEKKMELARAIIIFTFFMGCCTALLILGFAEFLTTSFNLVDEQYSPVLLVMFFTMPIINLSTIRQAILRAFNLPIYAQIPENIVYPLFLILFAFICSQSYGSTIDPIHLAYANIFAWIICLFVGFYFFYKFIIPKIKHIESVYKKDDWLKPLPFLTLSVAAYLVFSRVEVIVMGALLSEREVGLYTAAARGAELIQFMYEAACLVGTSMFAAHFASKDRKKLQAFTTRSTLLIVAITTPFYFLFIVLAPEFLLLFGNEFVAVTPVIRILITTFYLSTFGGYIIIMLYMTGDQREVAIVMWLAVGMNLCLSLSLIPSWGMMGAALASGISLILMKASLVYFLYRKHAICSLPIPLKK